MTRISTATLRRHAMIAALALGAAMTLASCNSKKRVLYVQDIVTDVPEVAQAPVKVKVEPGDKLSVSVTSTDPTVTSVFNLATGGKSGVSGGTLYTVNDRGCIDFPILGEVEVTGLTRQQISELIKKKLIDGKFVKDPVVTTEFGNLHFVMLGDVGSAGLKEINQDQVTIFEAIAMSGDLAITAERDQIYVIRTEDGVRTTTKVDVRTKDIFDSPVYYLKQNDIVYVVPNGKKTGDYSILENQWKNPTTYFGYFSFLVSLTSLIIAITK